MSVDAKGWRSVVTQMLHEEEEPLEWRRSCRYQTAFVASMDTALDVPKPFVVSKVSTHTRHGHVVAPLVEEMFHVTGFVSFENCKTKVR